MVWKLSNPRGIYSSRLSSPSRETLPHYVLGAFPRRPGFLRVPQLAPMDERLARAKMALQGTQPDAESAFVLYEKLERYAHLLKEELGGVRALMQVLAGFVTGGNEE